MGDRNQAETGTEHRFSPGQGVKISGKTSNGTKGNLSNSTKTGGRPRRKQRDAVVKKNESIWSGRQKEKGVTTTQGRGGGGGGGGGVVFGWFVEGGVWVAWTRLDEGSAHGTVLR